MICAICKQGNPATGFATVTLQRGDAIVVFKQVPADVCDNCGEYYLSSDVSAEVLARAENVIGSGAEVAIQRYAA